MPDKVTAAVLVEPHKIELRDFPYPRIGPEEGVLKVEMAGVCKTDVGFYKGYNILPEYPIILGHEILGRIEEVGEGAAQRWGVKPGDRVTVESSIRCNRCLQCVTGHYNLCDYRRSYGTTTPISVAPSLWGCYSEYMYLASNSMIHKLSEAVPAAVGATTCAVIANSIRWVRHLGQLRAGQSIVIQGVGQQGLAGVIAAKEAGASPIIATGISADEKRFALAKEFGADYLINVEETDPIAEVKRITDGHMADVVADMTGYPKPMSITPDLVAKRGRIVMCGISGTKTETPYIFDKILWKEATVVGALTHTVEAVEEAIKVVESQRFPLEKMITHRYTLNELEKAIKTVGRDIPGEDPIKVVVEPLVR